MILTNEIAAVILLIELIVAVVLMRNLLNSFLFFLLNDMISGNEHVHHDRQISLVPFYVDQQPTMYDRN